ncbi:hypothetical protein JW960_16365 [candidate division KSB1 bacterium]|nr:hypothetical protein [candidate division KSB1 bacterium]
MIMIHIGKLLKYRYIIFSNTIFVVFVSILLIYFFKPVYEAETEILSLCADHTQTTQSFGMAENQNLFFSHHIQWIDFSGDHIAFLKSRSIRTAIIRKFNLLDKYNVRTVDHALKKLTRRTKIKRKSKHIISIKVKDTSPVLASEIANEYVSQLRMKSNQLGMQILGQNTAKIEKQLNDSQLKVKTILNSLDSSLAVTQTVHSSFPNIPGEDVFMRNILHDLKIQLLRYQYIMNYYDALQLKQLGIMDNFQVLNVAIPPARPLPYYIWILITASLVNIFLNIISIMIVTYIEKVKLQYPDEIRKLVVQLNS